MKAIVTGDTEYVAQSFDNLPPGAHVAVRTSPTQLPDSGIALRLAGFEIRDTIAHVVGDRIVWWILARKPLDGTVAANVLAHGVGGLNIDACRVEGTPRTTHADGNHRTKPHTAIYGKGFGTHGAEPAPAGRFPANVLLDEHAAAEMDKQSGERPGYATQNHVSSAKPGMFGVGSGGDFRKIEQGYNDHGGASRFFPILDEDEAENWIRKLIDPDYPE